jgi:O-antigen ligase
MEVIDNGWGLPMTVLALLSVLAIFGAALWFILSATEINKKFRWFQIIGRRAEQDRSREGRKWERQAKRPR